MHATHGFPLELSLPILAGKGYVPAWDRLLEAARRDGANIARLVSRICSLAGETYGPQGARHIRTWLPLLAEQSNG